MPRDPENAVVTVPMPADFEEFWEQTLHEAQRVDPRPELVERPDLSSDAVRVWELRYTSLGGVRVSSWCAQPAGVPGPLPTAVHVPGYVSEPAVLKSWARRGYLAVDLAPRGKLRSNAVVNPGYPGLLVDNIVDRFAYTYRGFYTDVVRALDVLAGLDEVDPARIGVFGSSQGGGLGIVAAALRPDLVQCVAAGCPYLAGIVECPRWTHSYPYEEIHEYLRAHPDHGPLVAETAAYYDVLNFAPAVRAPVLLHLGMEDDVCPPETGFAVYRRLSCRKELHAYPGCGHDAGARWVTPKVEAFLDSHLLPDSVAAPDPPPVPRGGAAPDDRAADWETLDAELARYPARPVVEPHPRMSTPAFDGFRVWFSGLGGYRLFAYLSVPAGDGPFPAVLEIPRHGSVNNPPHYNDRCRYVMLTPAHRGQRLADVPFAAAYPGLFALGVADPATYVYRAIVADCLRAAELLLARDDVDPGRVAVTGEDLALLVAARRPGFAAVQVTAPLLHDAMHRRLGTDTYPLEELNDHLRHRPQDADAMAAALACYDPARLAGGIDAAVQLAVPADEQPWTPALVSALGDRLATYQRTGEDARDARALDAWLAARLGVEPLPRFLPEPLR